MMLTAFLVALVPAVYGAACDNCDIVVFYDQVGKSTDCDWSNMSLDCDGGAAIVQAASGWTAMCQNEAMKDQFQETITTAAKQYQDLINDQGIDCDAATGAGNETPAPDGSAANGIAYKFSIVVSAAFAYFLF